MNIVIWIISLIIILIWINILSIWKTDTWKYGSPAISLVLLFPFRYFYLCWGSCFPEWKVCTDTQQPSWCSWLVNDEFFSWGKKRALVLFMLNWCEIPRSKYMLSNTSCTFLFKQLSLSKCLFHHSYRLLFIRGIWPLPPQKGKARFHIAFQTTPFPGN